MNEQFNIIGLMSGTSVDGLDIALCSFKFVENWKFEILKYESVNYHNELRNLLLDAHSFSGIELKYAEIKFTTFCANNINRFKTDLNCKINLISSHGHTIFHQPSKGITVQIGNGEALAKLCGIDVVSDFRSGDVALGGQGAPLVPIGDELLFGDYEACLNIGGFSNLSYKAPNCKRIAYDISPVNIVLNKLCSKIDKLFDDRGMIAANGNIDANLLYNLNNLSYYSLPAPKSLGREWVENNVDPVLQNYNSLSVNDIISTYTIHAAQQIALNLKGRKNVLVTGGGAHNDFLISKIREFSGTNVIVPNKNIVEFKEALVFAFLGLLRYKNEINCLASVTGAIRDSCCGKISHA